MVRVICFLNRSSHYSRKQGGIQSYFVVFLLFSESDLESVAMQKKYVFIILFFVGASLGFWGQVHSIQGQLATLASEQAGLFLAPVAQANAFGQAGGGSCGG